MAYIGETDTTLSASATQVRTASYTPAGSTSLLGLIYGTYASLPWAAYGGGGNPGDGVNTYSLVGQAWDTGGIASFALSAAPAAGATSVALNVGYTGATGNAVVVFSSGETRAVHLTNGNPNIPDSGTFAALVGSSFNANAYTGTVLISGNPNVVGVYQATGSSNAPVQFGASSAATALLAAALIEYSGISLATAFNFNYQTGPGSGVNAVVGGNVSFSQGGVLLGFGFDIQSQSALVAGTSPLAFTSRSPLWSSATHGWSALLEDVAVVSANSPAQSTFKGGNQFDGYNTLSLFLPSSTNVSATPTSGAVTLGGQTPALVRGTVITPHVARGRILVPQRKIFLPVRAPQLRPHG